MPTGRYETLPAHSLPGEARPKEGALHMRLDPRLLGCGCVACANETGSYTVRWCPYHNQAHGTIIKSPPTQRRGIPP